MKKVWENPEIQSINRLKMSSPLIRHADENRAREEAAAGAEGLEETKSPYVKSLDGEWDFAFLDNPEGDENSAQWAKIAVPGTWTTQGYSSPWYTNVQMPFDTLPPNVPEQNPTGIYKLNVQMPQEWRGRRVVLHIGSAESCTIVYVNGKEIGLSKDCRLPCEFDVTPYLNWQNDEFKIKVIRWSDGSFVEDQDEWWFGGINRSVYLYSTEDSFIEDVRLVPELHTENIRANGTLSMYVSLGYAQAGQEVTRKTSEEMKKIHRAVKYTIHTLQGKPSCGTVGKLVADGVFSGAYDIKGNLNIISGCATIPNVRLWSHETPHLYLITLSLFEADENGNAGRFIESVALTTGFKSVEIKNRELLINGKMVYIKGVNRHEHSEYHGKTLTTAEMVRDIKILKSYNFNAVRTCHYPDDERWYDLCDRYGILIMDEANIENHCYYDYMARSDEWTAAYMQRFQRMVRRDKNHACIFSWSLGNESGDGANQCAMSAWVRRVDPSRIVHYEGAVRPPFHQGYYTEADLARGKGITDLISPMYPDIDLIVHYAKNWDDYRPLIMCEYSHAMGNANGSLSDYWQAIRSNHGLQGGFIWDWVDQGIAAEKDGKKYWKYGGDFGEFPHDADFCLNGINFPDMTPKPAMDECRYLFAPVALRLIHKENGTIEVENRYDFLTLSGLKLNWSVLKNGKAVKKGFIRLGKVLPDEKNVLHIPDISAVKYASSDEIVLRADVVYAEDTPFAQKGTLCTTEAFMIHEAESMSTFAQKNTALVDEKAIEAATNCIPAISRPLLENDVIKKMLPYRSILGDITGFNQKPAAQWIDSGLVNAKITEEENGEFSLDSCDGALKSVHFGNAVRTVKKAKAPNGQDALHIEVEISLNNSVKEYLRAGVQFRLPASYQAVRYYGLGPQECYCDRKAGAKLGLYESALKDLGVPYIVPQQNGDRADTRYLEFLSADGKKALHIQSAKPFSFCVSAFTDADIWKAEHTVDLTDTTEGENGFWTVSIDAFQRGVGTAACGPDALEQYRVRPGVYRLSFFVW